MTDCCIKPDGLGASEAHQDYNQRIMVAVVTGYRTSKADLTILSSTLEERDVVIAASSRVREEGSAKASVPLRKMAVANHRALSVSRI